MLEQRRLVPLPYLAPLQPPLPLDFQISSQRPVLAVLDLPEMPCPRSTQYCIFGIVRGSRSVRVAAYRYDNPMYVLRDPGV
jgi:hypothetical protein